MKNFLLVLVISLFLSSLASASESARKREILFSFGLPNSVLYLNRESPGYIVIKTDNPSKIEIDDGVQSHYNSEFGTLSLAPGNPTLGNYEYWKISGKYEDKKFFIFGYSAYAESDNPVENKMFIDIIVIIAGTTLLIVATLVIRKRNNTAAKKS
jgi:hypothetical protein